MTNFTWNNGSGGVWTTASDWTPSGTPGASDSATISLAPASGQTGYAVEVLGTVSVGSILLDQAAATLSIGELTNGVGTAGTLSTTLTAAAGTIALEFGSLSGTVIDTGASLVVGSYFSNSVTLANVTWEGTLNPQVAPNYYDDYGVLVIAGSLALLGQNGAGPGTLTLNQSGEVINFVNDITLNNAVLNIGASTQADLLECGNLTLGATTQLMTPAAAPDQASTGAAIETSAAVTNQGVITVNSDCDLSILPTVIATAFFNNGTVSVADGGYFNVQTLGFDNTGTINVAGTLNTQAGLLGNSGSISIDQGASLNLTGGAGDIWNNTGSITNAGTIRLFGTVTTAQLGSLAIHYAGGVLSLDGTLDNTAGTITLGAGGIAPQIALLEGTIEGGTITNAGTPGLLDSQFGTLNDVALTGGLSLVNTQRYASITLNNDTIGGSGLSIDGNQYSIAVEGSLVLTGNAGISLTGTNDTLAIQGGLDFAGAGGITLAGSGESLGFGGDTAFSGTILIGGTTTDLIDASATGAAANPTLTLLASNDVMARSGFSSLGEAGDSSSTIDNAGTVSAGLGATLTLGSNFINSGVITCGPGSLLDVDTASFFSSTQISLTGSTLAIGNLSFGNLAAFSLTDSTASLYGTLTGTGQTLTLGANGVLPSLLAGVTPPPAAPVPQSAQINGGTIKDAGGLLQVLGALTLANVAYDGVLKLAAPNATVVLENDTFANFAGSGAGSIVLSGTNATLQLDNTTTLDNVTITLAGAKGTSPTIDAINAPAGSADLGSHVSVVQTGGGAVLGDADSFISNASVTITAGQLTVDSVSFINNGGFSLGAKAVVVENASSFTNTGSIAVGHGNFELSLTNFYNQPPASGISFQNQGSITLAGGKFLELASAGVPAVALRNLPGGIISGYGTIAAPISNLGTIEANGGVLVDSKAITGTGTDKIDAGATLSLLGSVSAGQRVVFGGASGELGLAPKTFLGSIGGFVAGDMIDLANTTATAASFVGSSIVVTLSSGATLSLATTSALSGALSVTLGANHDSIISFAGAASHAAVLAASLPGATEPSGVGPSGFGAIFQPAALVQWEGHLSHGL